MNRRIIKVVLIAKTAKRLKSFIRWPFFEDLFCKTDTTDELSHLKINLLPCQNMPQTLAAKTMGTSSKIEICGKSSSSGQRSANQESHKMAAQPFEDAASDEISKSAGKAHLSIRKKLRPFQPSKR